MNDASALYRVTIGLDRLLRHKHDVVPAWEGGGQPRAGRSERKSLS